MIDSVIGNYRVTGELGEGAMGKVYVAEHQMLGHKVAIKVLHQELSQEPEVAQRFLNEARAASLVRHAGLINLLDCGRVADGTTFLVMELLEGESLGARLRREGRLDAETVVAVARQIADALAAAHAAGIVHRDLKPDNVFLTPDALVPGGVRAKVLDFGVAKLGGGGGVKTMGGVMMGTPMYMAPEQCRSAGQVDARADIYALGCMMYEMVTGRAPFAAREGLAAVLAAHLMETPVRPSVAVPVPRRLERLILRALEKKPEDRLKTMSQMSASLVAVNFADLVSTTPAAAAKAAPSPATPPTPSSQARTLPSRRGLEAEAIALGDGRSARQRWATRIVSAVAAAALLGGGLWLLH